MMIKTVLPSILLVLVTSGCVGTITHNNVAQDASNQRGNHVEYRAKGTEKTTDAHKSTEKQDKVKGTQP
jgi:uncharacterized protein YceK